MVVPKIYTTPSCPYCKMAKEFFKKNKVKYTESDVSADSKAADVMIEKSGQMGVPVIEIGDTIIVGFDKEEITQALKLDKKPAAKKAVKKKAAKKK